MSDEKIIKKEPQEIKLIAIYEPNGQMKINFTFLSNEIVTWGFLKLIEKTLAAHYNPSSKIVQPKGNIMNFVRNIKH